MQPNKIAGMVVVAILLLVAPAAAYNGQVAANYAYNNAYNNVPNSQFYNDRGGDCTNFVSHALQAGGWSETGKYWYSSPHAWYSDWHSNPIGFSYSWGAANNLYAFMYYGSRANRVSGPSQLEIGDIIQMDYKNTGGNEVPDGIWDHSMIVTGEDSRGLLISSHSTNRRNYPLSDIQSAHAGARFAGWHIY